MKHKFIIIIILNAFFYSSFSQNNKLEYGVYNISLGGIVGGVGALINNTNKEKPLKVFANGFVKGSIGGGFVHLSKLSVGEIAAKNKYEYSWLAKINNSIGTSIIENASLNRKIYDQININIGFNRIELYPTEKFKVKYKIMPISFLLTTYTAFTTVFEMNKSIKSGEFVFSSNKIKSNFNGYTLGTAIVLNNKLQNEKRTFSHELIHAYQYYDYNFVNSFLNKPTSKTFSDSSFFNNKKLFYYDLQIPILYSLYRIEYKSGESYYENFYEREAAVYSNSFNN